MVTSNKLSDRKVVKMAEQNNSTVVPQRTLIGEVNEHITCPLCRGYYIDATTIVECLHSFCRSCIINHLQAKSYCPVCEMMINSAKPNIKLDKALQDIVYKLVPGLFQKEMERRQTFYASRPGPAASATPEQRGEDTERIIFSPEDVISFSLEFSDATDADSISSKSSDSNDPQPNPTTTRRYLQCPAVVNINHLKKFLSMKFDIDSTQFAIDILYKRVPLPDYYTLMDIAYIYNWKRNEPMRFFYQIIDYIAIRNRLFDGNRKGSHFRDRKSSPASNEDTNTSSPTLNLHDHGSEASSGTDSPMPEDNSTKQINETIKNSDKLSQPNKDLHDKTNANKAISLPSDKTNTNKCISTSSKKTDEDAEKSQFLNSFELTPKSNCVPVKSSPQKLNMTEEPSSSNESVVKTQINSVTGEGKIFESLKRKHQALPNTPELKKLKIELEKTKITNSMIVSSGVGLQTSGNPIDKAIEIPPKTKESDGLTKNLQTTAPVNSLSTTMTVASKDSKHGNTGKHQTLESSSPKRSAVGPLNISSSKRKPTEVAFSPSLPQSPGQKTIKLQIPKTDTHISIPKTIDNSRAPQKKMPDLKPSTPPCQGSQQKAQPMNKVRMDFLANNSDPTIDRSKILSQVTTSFCQQNIGPASGDPLKSLFDSCKINIPSSLSITLTDQKLDSRNSNDATVDPKKGVVNKNLSGANTSTAPHKVPSPPVHNYIEILKLPDTELKKQCKTDGNSDTKPNSNSKTESPSTPPKPTKPSETSSKGPVPNLKPISDTKLGKQSGNYASPITFQQTFEQQVQFMQCDKKPKLLKNKAQVPKLVPATPKTINAASKPNSSIAKPSSSTVATIENKTGTALDLSTPHNIQNQYAQHQTLDKVFETMQSIANLAKKQNLPAKGLPMSMSQSSVFPSNRPVNTGVSHLRIPSTNNINQMKVDRVGPSGTQINRQEMTNKSINQLKSTNNASPTAIPSSPGYPTQQASLNTAQPSPRSQTRSPSSSPKLVIAEEKQTINVVSEQNINQSNQISSTQLATVTVPKTDAPRATPGPSKPGLKPVKTLAPAGKTTGMRQPSTSTMKTTSPMANSADYLTRPQLMVQQHHALLRQQIEMAWLKAQKPYDLLKSISSMTHQTQNDFNNKDKQ